MNDDSKISRLDTGAYVDLFHFYAQLLGREPKREELEEFQRHRQKMNLSTEASCVLLVSLAQATRQREFFVSALPAVGRKSAKQVLQDLKPSVRIIIAEEMRYFEKRFWVTLGFVSVANFSFWIFF